MKNAFFITGVSSGIGLACARFFLEQGHTVVGIGRNSVIEHDNYSFLKLDLSNAQVVYDFQLPNIKADEFILINNAGVLGDVSPVWEQSDENYSNVLQVNVSAAVLLSKKFINLFDKGLIINISSGAANRAIKGWSAYCASKAALDMFSMTLQEELTHYNKEFVVKSIAPGVVDTNMQSKIRESNPEHFPDSPNFHELYETNQLDNPDLTAKKLNYVIAHLADFNSVVLSLREIQI